MSKKFEPEKTRVLGKTGYSANFNLLHKNGRHFETDKYKKIKIFFKGDFKHYV